MLIILNNAGISTPLTTMSSQSNLPIYYLHMHNYYYYYYYQLLLTNYYNYRHCITLSD
jgi:hypothetical protein